MLFCFHCCNENTQHTQLNFNLYGFLDLDIKVYKASKMINPSNSFTVSSTHKNADVYTRPNTNKYGLISFEENISNFQFLYSHSLLQKFQ